MTDILINYRRSDSELAAHFIFDVLEDAFPGHVFIDIDRIPKAAEFPGYLREVLAKCTVILCLIGPNWLNAVGAGGRRRLDDPEDWVRIEIETGLTGEGVGVLPILLSGASMPEERVLPESLRPLVRRQAVEVPTKGFAAKIKELVPDIGRLRDEGALARKRAENAKSTSRLLPGDSFRDAPHLPVMVMMPVGRFRMGSLSREKGHEVSERPRHMVRLPDRFAVSKYPVTVYEWNFAVQAGMPGHGRIELPEKMLRAEGGELIRTGVLAVGETFDQMRGKIHPAYGIAWDGAVAYCAWASKETGRRYRLLSEAEWEYTCRGGTTSAFATGVTIDYGQAQYNRYYKYKHQKRRANEQGWNEGGSRPVTTCFENAFGLCGMHGNVWEWVQDCYHPSYDGAPDDGRPWVDIAPKEEKVVRGGCFASGENQLRSAFRGRAPRTPRSKEKFGLRVACEM